MGVQCMQEQQGCRAMPLCRGRARATCSDSRSPRARPFFAAGESPSGVVRLSRREDSYSTCEVPASLEMAMVWDEDRPALNGLWGAKECQTSDADKDTHMEQRVRCTPSPLRGSRAERGHERGEQLLTTGLRHVHVLSSR